MQDMEWEAGYEAGIRKAIEIINKESWEEDPRKEAKCYDMTHKTCCVTCVLKILKEFKNG